MALTEEQKERIRKNRERALKIQEQRRKQEERREPENEQVKGFTGTKRKTPIAQGTDGKNESTIASPASTKRTKFLQSLGEDGEGQSEWITKKEAMSMYCLPEGTLAVCEMKECDNPHNKSWSTMKLYRRSEIQQRAFARFGGQDGLLKERNKRRERQFANDFKVAKDAFGG